jgi:hypothetical protein
MGPYTLNRAFAVLWAEDSANMATSSAARRYSVAEEKNPNWKEPT